MSYGFVRLDPATNVVRDSDINEYTYRVIG